MKTVLSIPKYCCTLTIFFLFAINLNAQSTKVSASQDASNSSFNLTLQHATLVVSDIEQSKHFYIEVLGLELLDAPWLPKNQIFLSLGNNLELHVGEVEGVEINPSSFNHIAISTNDLDGFLRHLENKGITYSSLGGRKQNYIQKRPDGVRQTYIQDPDGYWIEINDAK